MKKLIYSFIAVLMATAVVAQPQTEAPKAEVIVFLSAKCPCAYNHKQPIRDLIVEYGDEVDFTAVFIRPNEDQEIRDQMARSLGWNMEFKYEPSGEYLNKYQPTVYSDVVLLNNKKEVIYRGGIDDGPLNSGWIRNFYLKDALEDYYNGVPVRVKEGKGIGCLIL